MEVVFKDKGSSYGCTNIATQEQRSQENRFTNVCVFQAQNYFKSFMLTRDLYDVLVEKGRRSRFYLFIKHWEDRIYVNTLNDYFNISCQMSIESVIQLLPVDYAGGCDPMFVYSNFYNCRFVRTTRKKSCSSFPTLFLILFIFLTPCLLF